MSSKQTKCTLPVLKDQLSAKATVPWFVEGVGKDAPCTFQFLNCGKDAFGAIYRAIEKAQCSVNYICWSFQPSMYFIRDGCSSLPIGKLLEEKVREKRKMNEKFMVRVLCWSMDLLFDMNIQAVFSGESNQPGRHVLAFGDRPETLSAEQYEYDKFWYLCYDRNANPEDVLRVLSKPGSWWHRREIRDSLEFRGRDFTLRERLRFASKEYDTDVSWGQRLLYGISPTHHQKAILIDYELPEHHVGFVMGHNTLDEYWDTTGHNFAPHWRKGDYLNHTTGRNGKYPRQDVSAQVTGPIVEALYDNFRQAWEAANGGALPDPPIPWNEYPLYTTQLEAFGQADTSTGESFVRDITVMASIVRTHTTGCEKERHGIKETYLHVIKMATQYIYVENQYFRWMPFADAVLEAACVQTANGRDPAEHGSLYLFVVTNSSEDGVGPGTQKTYEMLESLGRADTIPNVARENRIDDLDTRIRHARFDLIRAKVLGVFQFLAPDEAKKKTQETIEELEAEIEELEDQRNRLENKEPIQPEERPGLKIHVCSLTSPDTPAKRVEGLDKLIKQARKEREKIEKTIEEQSEYDKRTVQTMQTGCGLPDAHSVEGKKYRKELDVKFLEELEMAKAKVRELEAQRDGPWPEVYIHAKLMLINDTYMTLGSANINTRSMEVDTEMNICHYNEKITQKVRQDLWNQHTKGRGAQNDMETAFKKWAWIIKQNKDNEKNEYPPVCSLRGLMITQKKNWKSTFD